MSTFHALDVAHEVVRAVRAPLQRIAAKDRDLASQLRRAAQSVPLNLAEAGGRSGADRRHCYRIAYVSQRELRACLRVAQDLGYVAAADVAEVDRLADRVGAMLWSLTR
jgi:four helix bundle protein